MARPSLEQLRQLGDFVETFRWNMRFAQFPKAIAGQSPAAEALNIRCETAARPKSQPVADTKVEIRGHSVHQPSKIDYSGTMSFTFVETVDMMVHRFFKSWRDAIWNARTGISSAKADLQGIVILEQLNRQDRAIWRYQLIGAYLQDYEFGPMDAGGTEAMKPTMTLQYDYFTDEALA